MGPPADLWALGLIAFRLLTGQNYWTAEGMAALIGQIVYDPMPSASGSPTYRAVDAKGHSYPIGGYSPTYLVPTSPIGAPLQQGDAGPQQPYAAAPIPAGEPGPIGPSQSEDGYIGEPATNWSTSQIVQPVVAQPPAAQVAVGMPAAPIPYAPAEGEEPEPGSAGASLASTVPTATSDTSGTATPSGPNPDESSPLPSGGGDGEPMPVKSPTDYAAEQSADRKWAIAMILGLLFLLIMASQYEDKSSPEERLRRTQEGA